MMSARLFNRLEKIFFTLALFLLTDNFSPFINSLGRKPFIMRAVNFLAGIPLNQVGRVVRTESGALFSLSIDVAFWFTLLMLFVRPGLFAKVCKMLWNNAGVVALLILACVSWFWSIAPNATLNGVYLVVKITLVAIYISQIYSLEEILDLLVGVIALASVFSILVIWSTPGWSTGGQWHGIYSSKNYLGRLMAFGNAMLIVYWLKNRGAISKRILALGLFILTGILLAFSDSATSLLALMGMYGALILYGVWTRWIVRLNARMRSFLIVLGIAALILVVLNNQFIFALVNRTPTLTGRIDLWKVLWTWFQKRPVFGFGYEAFWQQLPNGLFYWKARHAHNGYIEIVLSLGLIGLIIFLVSLVISWKRAFILLRQEKRVVFFWPIMALIFLTLSNITYSMAFGFPNFYWALFIIVAGVVPTTGPRTPNEAVLAHDLVDD
jgi:O-antigen ligase